MAGCATLLICRLYLRIRNHQRDSRNLKQTTTVMAKRTSPNKRFNEQNNSCAHAYESLTFLSSPLQNNNVK